jgi:glutaredoxin
MNITIYTTTWCGDCRNAKAFPDRNSIPFRMILHNPPIQYLKELLGIEIA